jgi:predicted dehydrogenase
MHTKQEIRIGIIGAGNIGSIHIKAFHNLPGAVITAVSDVFRPLAEKRAAEYGIPHVYESADELIESVQVDAVIIAVSNEWHAPYAVKALQAGKHVLLEKPMALNAEAAKEIVRAERKAGKVLMIPHTMRWEPFALQVKEQLDKGELGNIYYAKTGWLRRKGIPGWGTWFTQKNKSGGGPLIDIGVHMLDLSLYLMGNPKPISVYGSTYAEFGPKRKGIGTWGTPDWRGFYNVEDLASAMIKMEDGSTLTLEVSWAAHTDMNNEPFVHLFGSEGGLNMTLNKGKFMTEAFNEEIDVELSAPKEYENSRTLMSRHFLDCIQSGSQPITSVMTGYTNNLILEAIYESSRTGHEIKLDWTI